jgi:hypothetical protein
MKEWQTSPEDGVSMFARYVDAFLTNYMGDIREYLDLHLPMHIRVQYY